MTTETEARPMRMIFLICIFVMFESLDEKLEFRRCYCLKLGIFELGMNAKSEKVV